MKAKQSTMIIALLLTLVLVSSAIPILGTVPEPEDFNPLVNTIYVAVTIKEIRALDQIDLISNPDFYVKVSINDKNFTSPVWRNMKYVTNPEWSATNSVPKDKEWVSITIQLWDKKITKDKLCDISSEYTSSNRQYYAELSYSLRTGHWRGDDWTSSELTQFDPSGYGRLNGCDDGSIDQHDRDCALWFDITQTDSDGDGIPYLMETNIYNTSPTVNDSTYDPNHDGIPITWDWKWGYDPFSNDQYATFDPDNDGLNNTKEFLTSQWGSDPFRKDIFLELDQMKLGPNGEGAIISQQVKDMLRDPYEKHNIVFHIDDGSLGGGEWIPFDKNTSFEELGEFYWKYFMHENADNWRRGVFHYGLITYHSDYFHGFAFGSYIDENHSTRLDCFQISTREHEVIPFKYPLMRIIGRGSINKENNRDIVYASAMMHETGHVLGIFHGNTPGNDNQTGKFPWQKNWWYWRNYKSCMNYGWMYTIVDYSDGSNGKNDFDDWGRIDLTRFQRTASNH